VADSGRGVSGCNRSRWKPGICRSTGEVYGGASSKPSSYAGGWYIGILASPTSAVSMLRGPGILPARLWLSTDSRVAEGLRDWVWFMLTTSKSLPERPKGGRSPSLSDTSDMADVAELPDRPLLWTLNESPVKGRTVLSDMLAAESRSGRLSESVEFARIRVPSCRATPKSPYATALTLRSRDAARCSAIIAAAPEEARCWALQMLSCRIVASVV